MSKKQILDNLRHAIARAPVGSFGERIEQVALDQARPYSELTTLDWLGKNCKKNSATIEICTHKELAQKVHAWAIRKKPIDKKLYIAEHDSYLATLTRRLQKTPLALTTHYLPQEKQFCGVASVAGAIAETATIVAHSMREGKNGTFFTQSPSLHYLCDHYCAIVEQKNVYRYMEDYWSSNAKSAIKQRSIHFISGPSRTGDIEQTIEIGAHGPLSVHLIVVGS